MTFVTEIDSGILKTINARTLKSSKQKTHQMGFTAAELLNNTNDLTTTYDISIQLCFKTCKLHYYFIDRILPKQYSYMYVYDFNVIEKMYWRLYKPYNATTAQSHCYSYLKILFNATPELIQKQVNGKWQNTGDVIGIIHQHREHHLLLDEVFVEEINAGCNVVCCMKMFLFLHV